MSLTSLSLIVSPKPTPYGFSLYVSVFSILPNYLNRFYNSLLSIPIPVSSILNYISSLLCEIILILICPFSVNLIALDSRFSSTYISLFSSVKNAENSYSYVTSTINFSFLALIWNDMICSISFITFPMFVGS